MNNKLLQSVDKTLSKLQDKKWFYKRILKTSCYDILNSNAKYAVQACKDHSWGSTGVSISGDITMLCDKLFLTYEIAHEEYLKHEPYIQSAEDKDRNDGIEHADDEICLWTFDRTYKEELIHSFGRTS